MGFTDLHCHLLWGLDDGAKTPGESLAMARALVALGFEAVAPSPHAKPGCPDAAAAAARREELQALLDREGVRLRLHAGAENFLDDDFVAAAPTPARRSIGGGRYVLVEAPYVGRVPNLPEVLFRLRVKAVSPVIAHPERCAEFEHPGSAAEAVRVGAALQLDVGALIGRYGRTAKKLAFHFLQQGLYAVAATDLHSPVEAEAWVGRSLRELERAVGQEGVARLLERNPARILAGEELDIP